MTETLVDGWQLVKSGLPACDGGRHSATRVSDAVAPAFTQSTA
ncbi:MAG: hypothetical protein WCA21_15645 [Terracidiphilus sp.]